MRANERASGPILQSVFLAVLDLSVPIVHGGIRLSVSQFQWETSHISLLNALFTQILKNFNLNIEAGKTVALVGESGSGKSTTLQLLMRLYDPESGQVSLDGEDLRNLNPHWLRKSVGFVTQMPTLFAGTILENIK